jgi:uncharacterized DUF497 family protein
LKARWLFRRTARAGAGVAIGVSIRGVVVVAFARLGREGVSIISMRPAAKDERKQYAER